MKLKSTCLFVTLLALAALAATADTAVPATAEEAAAPVAVPAPDLAGNCGEAKSAPFFRSAFEKPSTSLTEVCTQCSEPHCIGAPLGKICLTASGQLGNCYVFGAGGTSCESVGPDCECGLVP